MRDFFPFGVRAIEVKFKCNNCGHKVISEEIDVPMPDFSADNHSDSQRDNDGYATCPNCGKDYDVYVYTTLGGGDVDIPDIEDEDIIEIIEHDEEYDADDELYPEEPKEEIKPIYTGFRLLNLEIKDWYVLKDFYIHFENNINVLIGENGSGKSSVIESLASIFGHLHRFFVEDEKKAPYINGYNITFQSQHAMTGRWYTISVDNTRLNNVGFNPIITIQDTVVETDSCKDLMKHLLPTKIGLYYAGVTERLQNLSSHFENNYRKQVTTDKNPATLSPLNLPNTRPFLYVKKGHLGIMLMCLLISENKEIEKGLKDEIGIKTHTSEIKFVFKKPSWAKDTVDNIWGASDLARQFITLLIEYADKKKISEKEISLTHSSIYLKDEFHRIFPNYTESNIFDIFDFLLFNNLLDNINIKWQDKKGEFIELDHLSEGEKQLITTMAFRLLWTNQKGFLLFDEPDTFMHPKWQQQFISNLSRINENTQIIITTHSPNIVSNVEKKQLVILDSGKVKQFVFNPYGKTVENILVDHFSLKSTRNKEVQAEIDTVKQLIENDQYNSPECIELIENLKNKIDNTDKDLISINLEIARKKYLSANEKNK